MAVINVTLSWEQLEVLKKLIFLIDIAKGKSIVEGEGKSGSDKVEWDSSEIKMTVA